MIKATQEMLNAAAGLVLENDYLVGDCNYWACIIDCCLHLFGNIQAIGIHSTAAEVITTPGATADAAGHVLIGQKTYELFLGNGLEAKEV